MNIHEMIVELEKRYTNRRNEMEKYSNNQKKLSNLFVPVSKSSHQLIAMLGATDEYFCKCMGGKINGTNNHSINYPYWEKRIELSELKKLDEEHNPEDKNYPSKIVQTIGKKGFSTYRNRNNVHDQQPMMLTVGNWFGYSYMPRGENFLMYEFPKNNIRCYLCDDYVNLINNSVKRQLASEYLDIIKSLDKDFDLNCMLNINFDNPIKANDTDIIKFAVKHCTGNYNDPNVDVMYCEGAEVNITSLSCKFVPFYKWDRQSTYYNYVQESDRFIVNVGTADGRTGGLMLKEEFNYNSLSKSGEMKIESQTIVSTNNIVIVYDWDEIIPLINISQIQKSFESMVDKYTNKLSAFKEKFSPMYFSNAL